MILRFKKVSLFILAAVALIFSFSASLPAKAISGTDQEVDKIFWGGEQSSFDTALDNNLEKNTDPYKVAAKIINFVLSFLGLLSVIIILAGGFIWMTSFGNDEKIKKAKDMIVAGLIGLIIILSAYAISQFVLRELLNATN